MEQLADNLRGDLAPGLPTLIDVDEGAARRSLRGQITKLERDLAGCLATARGEPLALATRASYGPRLLGLGELEQMRDDLAERLHGARAELGHRADEQEAHRVLLERMRLTPRDYKYVRVTAQQLGERGCWAWHVRPRLGIIGMMMGWWQVKLSSGCPLATGHRRRA
jgi:hypothetical protein